MSSETRPAPLHAPSLCTAMAAWLALLCSCTAVLGPTDDADFILGKTEEAAEAADWTWHDVGGTHCMDGSPSGLVVRRGVVSDKLLLYLTWGGACFEDDPLGYLCEFDYAKFGPREWMDGPEDPRSYAGDRPSAFYRAWGTSGVLDSHSEVNPFRDWHHVAIPFCSGDVFVGTVEASRTGYRHTGLDNMTRYLEWLGREFSEVSQVVVVGSSAGSLGAVAHYERIRAAFPSARRVDLVADSPLFFNRFAQASCLQKMLQRAWDANKAMPPGCSDCIYRGEGVEAGYHQLLQYMQRAYPDARFAVVASDADHRMSKIVAYAAQGCSMWLSVLTFSETAFYRTALQLESDLLAQRCEDEGTCNARLFIRGGTKHVHLMESLNKVRASVTNESLSDWLGDFLESEDWKSAGEVTPFPDPYVFPEYP